jgi:hypothetical protein
LPTCTNGKTDGLESGVDCECTTTDSPACVWWCVCVGGGGYAVPSLCTHLRGVGTGAPAATALPHTTLPPHS